jgi:predicted amidophosphoribosyltransferase
MSNLLPPVCAHCHHPVPGQDDAFCAACWLRLSHGARTAIVGARNEARRLQRPTKALLHAVRRGKAELEVTASLAPLAAQEG